MHFILALTTHTSKDVWLIDLDSSFHMTLYRGQIMKYEEYDGGKMYLGDDSHLNITDKPLFRYTTNSNGFLSHLRIFPMYLLRKQQCNHLIYLQLGSVAPNIHHQVIPQVCKITK